MMGCMAESTVGVSAIAQFLPLLDYVDMDGPLLLARDTARAWPSSEAGQSSPRERLWGAFARL